MTTLQLKLTLPDELAKQARAAGLLKSEAIVAMLRERLRQQAGEELPMTEEEIQAEIDAVRKARKAGRRA